MIEIENEVGQKIEVSPNNLKDFINRLIDKIDGLEKKLDKLMPRKIPKRHDLSIKRNIALTETDKDAARIIKKRASRNSRGKK